MLRKKCLVDESSILNIVIYVCQFLSPFAKHPGKSVPRGTCCTFSARIISLPEDEVPATPADKYLQSQLQLSIPVSAASSVTSPRPQITVDFTEVKVRRAHCPLLSPVRMPAPPCGLTRTFTSLHLGVTTWSLEHLFI